MFLGIDFGTTHSSMTVVGERGEPEVIPITPNDEPYDTILRTAAFIPRGTELEPGQLFHAEVHQISFHNRSIQAKKGLLLKHFKPYFSRWSLKYWEDCLEEASHYDPLAEMHRDRQVAFRKEERNPPYSRQEIVFGAAAVLARLKLGMGQLKRTPAQCQQILLGNPVGFRGFSRGRMLQACWWSGLVGSARQALQKIRFVYEPVAVACSAIQAGLRAERALVFDFGGGTLDLAVVRFEAQGGLLHPEEIEAVRGLPVAGHHIDWKILHFLLKSDAHVAQELESRRARSGKSAVLEILEYVEAVKKDLSRKEEASYPYGQGSMVLKRSQLETILAPFLEKIRSLVEGLLSSLPESQRHIDRVVTAGGSSLIPSVQQVLKDCFRSQVRPPRFHFWSAASDQRGGEVEKALLGVARGLSLYGRRMDLRERTDRALFVLNAKDEFVEVLPKNLAFEPEGEGRVAKGPRLPLLLPTAQGLATLAIYEEGPMGKEYLVQYCDIPAEPAHAEWQCSLEKGALLPVFRVGNRVLDPLEQPEENLQSLLQDDEACLSFAPCLQERSPRLPCLRLGLGDEIQVDHSPKWSGRVIEIRRREGWHDLREATPDLSSYLLRTERNSARSQRFELQAGQCRVIRRGGHHQHTTQDNLFTEQLRQELSAHE